jgi:hypothetical protein
MAPFGGGPSGALLDVHNVAMGNLEEVNHVPSNVGQDAFFLKQVATGRHAVEKRKGGHSEASVGIDLRDGRRVNFMNVNREGDAVAKEVEKRAKEGFGSGGGIDVDVGRAPLERQSGNQARKPQAMVTMKVGNEDMTQMMEAQTGTAEL